ncbi:hypothetical protein V6N12_063712 [Hibiscus sabdariffa]|uniref:RNase H type-1 domain-containing protein n=1 Tax=Hibiscus sabdariffa TaxID=183260 RepID=A0ABR2FCQ7_9ROSI
MRLWSSSVLDYALSPSIGSSGGLLSMWDTDYFQVDEKIIMPRFIALIGCIKHKNFTCGILNVYGPTVKAEKGDFLGDLLALIRQKQCNEKGYEETAFSAIGGLKLKKPLIKIGRLLKGTKSALKSWVVETNQKNNGTDIWALELSLKEKFPRIFALACNKVGRISEFGSKGATGRCWLIHLRCNLFDWEQPQWNELMVCLQNFNFSNLDRDGYYIGIQGYFSKPGMLQPKRARQNGDNVSVESLMADFSLATNLIHYVNRGNSKSEIGGLLRDESGMILMEFSEASSLSLSALVELEAINFGISNFLTTPWSLTHRLIVESDCKMVVDWINGMVEPLLELPMRLLKLQSLCLRKACV